MKDILMNTVKIYNDISNEESIDVGIREEIALLKRVNFICTERVE